MAKDPERIKRRAAEAAKLGITEDELRQRRLDEDAANLARKAEEAGVSVERYLDERRRQRNQSQRARRAKQREKLREPPEKARGFTATSRLTRGRLSAARRRIPA